MEKFQINVDALSKAGAANTNKSGGFGSFVKVPTRHLRYAGNDKFTFTEFGMQVTQLDKIEKGLYFYGNQNGLTLIGVGPREKADSMKSTKAITLAEKNNTPLNEIDKGKLFTSDIFRGHLAAAGLLPKEDVVTDGKVQKVDFYLTSTGMAHPKDGSEIFVVQVVDDEARKEIARSFKELRGIDADTKTEEDDDDDLNAKEDLDNVEEASDNQDLEEAFKGIDNQASQEEDEFADL